MRTGSPLKRRILGHSQPQIVWVAKVRLGKSLNNDGSVKNVVKVCESLGPLMGGMLKVCFGLADVAGRKFFYCTRSITHSYNCSNPFVVTTACYMCSKPSRNCETHSIANCGSCSTRERVVMVLCITARVAECACVSLRACVCACVCSRMRACMLEWVRAHPSVFICTPEHIHEVSQAFRPARAHINCAFALTHICSIENRQLERNMHKAVITAVCVISSQSHRGYQQL